WWLNGSAYALRPSGARSETSLIPAAPDDLLAALGALDRKIYIVPSRKLIVVRTGQAAPDRALDQQGWRRMMRAMPKQESRRGPADSSLGGGRRRGRNT